MIVYAFWDYDSPPYLLAGMVVGTNPNGTVRIIGYPGFGFRPRKLLLDNEGEEAMLRIKFLDYEYRRESAELRRKYRDLGLEAIGEV